jgi:hypothetical protein
MEKNNAFEEIQEQLDTGCSIDSNLMHIKVMFFGYRAELVGDSNPYSPGSAADYSFKVGVTLAKKDRERFLCPKP